MKRGCLIAGIIVLYFVLSSSMPFDVKNFKEASTTNYEYKIVYRVYVPKEYRLLINTLNMEYGIPPWILPRMIKKESEWKVKAVSKKNDNGSIDYGLMQLNSNNLEEFTWRFNDFKEIDYFDPVTNITIGAKYLAHLYKQFGTWEEAIMAYNCGPTKVRKNKIPPSTKVYVNEIMSYSIEKVIDGEF